jgi:hypothetical protein
MKNSNEEIRKQMEVFGRGVTAYELCVVGFTQHQIIRAVDANVLGRCKCGKLFLKKLPDHKFCKAACASNLALPF